MKISLNIIKQFVGIELPGVDELVQRINTQLGGVENIIDLGAKYKDAQIVRVVECEKHPDADRLSICQIDAGTGELVQVVCGAPNVRAEMWAIWLPPESIVPATYDDDEPFKLGARELRGVMSHGMLAAGDELALNDDHDGIVEIHESDLAKGKTLVAGASFAELFDLDDTIIEIENKMFTHRPDCFGQLGVAREISAILQGTTGPDEGPLDTRFENPDWYWYAPEFAPGDGMLSLEVFNDVVEKVPRFMAVAVHDVSIRPSPLWLQGALIAMGSKPINNVVDLTNYIMLITGQPTHAYDYDKLRGAKLGARMATPGETVQLLNGKSYTLHGDDIVIADGEGVIGVGGIMGAANSEVSTDTTNIVLEVATFDMYAVRKTSMRHGLFTDALTRFNKGQSKLQNDHVVARLLELFQSVVKGNQASNVFDIPKMSEDFDRSTLSGPIVIDTSFIGARLGIKLTTAQVGNLLRRVNIASYAENEGNPDTVVYTAPFWRTDIELPEDIVEEVGRLYGFDKLPRELPRRSTAPAPKNIEIEAKQRLRETLTRAGANEVLTYSFVHENVLKKAGQDPAQAFELSNALSPDLQYYRLSVLPSLLDKVHMNIKAGHDEFLLFEVGKAHHVAIADDGGIPKEFGRVAGVYAARKQDVQSGAAYYQARSLVDNVVASVAANKTVSYKRLDQYDAPNFAPFLQMIAPFDPVRSAIIEIEGKLAGVVGELRASVAKNFKLPVRTSAFELFVSPFVSTEIHSSYVPLSRYPSVQRDVCFQVNTETTYEALFTAAAQHSEDEIDLTITPVDIYQEDSSTKNITLRFDITSYTKTLTSEEVAKFVDDVVESVASQTDARVV